MSSPGRREFLEALFKELDQRSIAYVVLRNFDSVFDESSTDVDLLAGDADGIFCAAVNAANATGHKLVQKTRFVNHSWVWWNGDESFTRVDVDTELRWRCFQSIATREILDGRIRQGPFFVPCPDHEAEGIRVNVANRGGREARYDQRLGELGSEPAIPASERSRLIRRNLAPQRWIAVLGHIARDIARLLWRKRNPVGLVLQIHSSIPFSAGEIADRLALLFPPSKRAQDASPRAIRDALFRGGLAVDCTEKADDSSAVAGTKQGASSRRTVIAFLDSKRCLYLADMNGGWMRTVSAAPSAAKAIATFVCDALSRDLSRSEKRRGLSVMLVGVDGAGKSTFARNLFERALESRRFSGCSYFHWIPRCLGRVGFPFPVYQDLPRNSGASSPVLSIIRLLKNLGLAWLGWFFRVLPAVRKGRLVVLDRFIANYWLDPASVRYSGSSNFLRVVLTLFPKPDVLIALDADPEILRSRKGELTIEQIRAQQTLIRSMPRLARVRLDMDAALPSQDLVDAAFQKLSSFQ